MGLTFAQYVLQPFFPNCAIPDDGVRLIAAVTICKIPFLAVNSYRRSFSRSFTFLIGLLTFANCSDVKETSKMQNVFMFAKVGALIIIVIAGLAWLALGKCNYNLELDQQQ